MKSVIEGFRPTGGKHCITTALRQVFDYYGCSLSEEMIFGLGEGLDFTYINLADAPLISGRSKVAEFEERLAKRLDIKLTLRSGKDYDKIFALSKKMIDAGKPVLVYADMPYLLYLSLDENSHFGGHAVVIFGYDEDNQVFYVSDRDSPDCPVNTPKGPLAQHYHLVGFEQMQKARSSSCRPFPANNKYIADIDFGDFQCVKTDSILLAIAGVCDKLLNPPAKLKGISGIEKFSREILKWSSFTQDKIKKSGITNFFQISRDGGTGGGIFRSMYGGFLLEASSLLSNTAIADIGRQFLVLADSWDLLADRLFKLYLGGDPGYLTALSADIRILHDTEFELISSLQKECQN